MTIAVDLGRKATKQTNKVSQNNLRIDTYLLCRLTYTSQIWHMYLMNCPASEYAIYKTMHGIDHCCLATEECEIMACVHAGIKRCHGNTLQNLSYINLCICSK